MKLIPGKYLYNDENGNLCTPGPDFELPLWDYIEMCLHNLNMEERDLIPLFDITPSALSNWKMVQNKYLKINWLYCVISLV